MNEYERLKANVDKSPAYKSGTKGHYDAHSHILSCIVLEVIEEGNGVFVNQGKLLIRLTKTNGPYKKGEEMTVKAFHCIPKGHRTKREHKTNINKWYRWVK